MSSTSPRTKSASTSGRSDNKSSHRRHEQNISDPIPTVPRRGHTLEQHYGSYESHTSDPRQGSQSHQYTPALSHSFSSGHLQTTEVVDDRVSMGPSIVMSSMSSMPSLRDVHDHSPNQKRAGGIKATIKRMFGSKRHRTATNEPCQGYYLSDPGNLMNTDSTPVVQRSIATSNRPRTATQATALGSHAINPASSIRDFGTQLTGQPLSDRKRRNSLPSLVFSEHEAQSFSRRLGVMMDGSEQVMHEDPTSTTYDKPRSMSVDALVGKLPGQEQAAVTQQDRDSETAFWRNSILLNSLPKATRPATEDRLPEKSPHSIKEVPSLESIIRPAQSFDFGLHTAAHDNDLEERVNTLEVKMFDFEYAIAKLQGVELPKPLLPTKQMKRQNVQQVYSKPSIRSLSTATSSCERIPITPTDSPLMPPSLKEQDRVSNDTVRPLGRGDSTPRKSLRITADQFDTLMGIIQDEKDARQLMEMQIIQLQREVELLQSPVYATINYPSAGSESYQKKLHRSPPFGLQKSLVHETSSFTMTESDAESFDDGFEEDYATPNQQQYRFENVRSSSLANRVF